MLFHLENLNKSLASCSPNYKTLTILGDFNIGIDNRYIGGFYDIHGFKILITEPTGNKKKKKINLC